MEGFVSIWHQDEGMVDADTPLSFESGMVPASPTGGISVPDPTTIQLDEPGVYEALFHVLPIEEARSVELRVNGTMVPGGRVSNRVSATAIDGKVLFQVGEGDVPAMVTLQNYVNGPISYDAVTPQDTTASLAVMKLGDG
jgi:hypothetical protein